MYAFVTYTCIRIRKFSLGFSGNICHDVWPLRGEFETITVCPLALRYNDTVCRLLRWRLFALSTVEKIKKKRFRKYSPSRLRRYGRGGERRGEIMEIRPFREFLFSLYKRLFLVYQFIIYTLYIFFVLVRLVLEGICSALTQGEYPLQSTWPLKSDLFLCSSLF